MSERSRPKPGQTIHFLTGAFSFPERITLTAGTTAKRGMELEVTEAMIEASLDRNGDSWLDLLDDPDGQAARWGRVVYGPGPFPDDQVRTEPRTFEYDEAKAAAYSEARAVYGRDARAVALRRVEEQYGPADSTSRTVAHYSAKN